MSVTTFCKPGDQFNVNLAQSSFTFPVTQKALPVTVNLDPFNATFTVQAPSSADQGGICSATGNTDTNGGIPTPGRFIEVGPVFLPTIPVAFATTQVYVTVFKTAPTSVALGSAPPSESVQGTIFTGAHNVWLNQGPGGQVLEWYTPGFKTFVLNPLGSPIQIRDTGPLEDWVDLGDPSLNLTPQSDFATIVNQAEQLIEASNAQIVFVREVLPYLALSLIFDPGNTALLVTGPDGSQTGATANGTVVQNIPGSAYFPTVPLVVVAAPGAGTYETQVTGLASSTYELVTALITQDQVLAQQSFTGPISAGLTVDYSTALNPQQGSLTTSLVLTNSLTFFSAFIDQLQASGQITNEGIANSLRQKLDNAEQSVANGDLNSARGILGAFLNEVDAQSGKHIAATAADDLTAYALFLLGFVS